MSNTSFRTSPKYPGAQPFSIKGSSYKSKKNSWWNPKSPNFWRAKKNNVKSVKDQTGE